uniref:Uncharacterized protein n=1 Tax=Panagrolaimus sp. PS1159 TaxID=55785 RepID=A0AC35G4J5_9BILA
ELNLVLKI